MAKSLKSVIIADVELFVALKLREQTSLQTYHDKTQSDVNKTAAIKRFTETQNQSSKTLATIRKNLKNLEEREPPTKGQVEQLAYAISAALRKDIEFKSNGTKIDRTVIQCVSQFYRVERG